MRDIEGVSPDDSEVFPATLGIEDDAEPALFSVDGVSSVDRDEFIALL